MSRTSAKSSLRQALQNARKDAAMKVYQAHGIGQKSDTEVAKSLGTSEANIRHIRWSYKLGTPPVSRMSRLSANNRRLSKEKLMKLLRVGESEAAKIQIALGLSKRVPRYQLVDWNKPNQQIAAEEGLKLGTVAVMRAQAKKAGLKVPRSSLRRSVGAIAAS